MYTRLATVPLALLQAFGFIKLLHQSQAGIFGNLTTVRLISIMLIVTAGTVFLMWLGELITERKVGNGTSLIIFAGIVSALPQTLQTLIVNYTPSDLYTYLIYAAIIVITVGAVVIMSEGQRNIPVTYAKQMRGRGTFGNVQSHLPLRVNMAGVIPIIFAISIILFPTMAAQFFVNNAGRIGALAKWVMSLFKISYFTAFFIF